MGVTQSTYAENQDNGLPGMIANGEDFNSFSRTVETAAGIGFGQPAFKGSADRGCIATYALTGVAAALGTNTGDGTFGTITVAAPARTGVYTLTIVEPGSNVGTFVVANPDGEQIGDGVVGSAFSAGGLSFTLADGSADFVAGDSFKITVSGSAFLGVTRRNPAVSPTDGDKFAQYREAAIVDFGVVFVKVEEAVTAGAKAYWNPSTKLWSVDAVNDAPIIGCVYDAGGSANAIVPLRIRRPV